MIFRILLNYITGFVNITVEGFFIERFINNCIKNRIFLWSIRRTNSSILTANISINQFKKLHKLSNKTKCRVELNSKHGLPILIHKYRKRKVLVLIILPVLVGVIILSRFIWNIEIIGLDNIDKDEIIQELDSEGIKIGKIKSQIDTEKVISNIRLRRNDISWMSIDIKGTNAIINIVKAKEKPNIIDENLNCNIVATKKALITKITAETGTALVKEGDIVNENAILISGTMEGKYTGIRAVHAKGNVQGKVWYTKKLESYYTREIINKTGNEKNIYVININNFIINLYKTLPNFENYDKINTVKKLKILPNFYLPIAIEKTTFIEKEKSEITYGKEELKDLLISELESKFREENIENLNVVNKVVNIYYKENDVLEIEMTYEVIENIGTEEKINSPQ